MLDAAHGKGRGSRSVVQRVHPRRVEVQVARTAGVGAIGRKGGRRAVVALRADGRQGSRSRTAIARSRSTSCNRWIGCTAGALRPLRCRLACTADAVAPADCGIYSASLTGTLVSAIPDRDVPYYDRKRIKNSPRRCWTQRTERADARFALFSGFTLSAFRFK